jgi:hypothetical protein
MGKWEEEEYINVGHKPEPEYREEEEQRKA